MQIHSWQNQISIYLRKISIDDNKLSIEKLRHRFAKHVKNYSGKTTSDLKSNF